MAGGSLNGLDALYSMVQMPQGVPVGCMAIGKAGAVNAGVFAAQILAVKYPALKKKLSDYKKKLAKSVEEKDEKLQKSGIKGYLKGKK
jgi:5-(carboxyamino)imidazole ribonucleotide mutase